MRPEATVQRRGNRSAPDFSWLFASSVMYVASLTGMTREKRNHIRHHQPQKPTVRESGVAPPSVLQSLCVASVEESVISIHMLWCPSQSAEMLEEEGHTLHADGVIYFGPIW